MYPKILFILVASFLLGGCNISLNQQAAVDTKSPEPAQQASSPMPAEAADPELDAMQDTDSQTDVSSIELDLNNTVILPEDFSDLE